MNTEAINDLKETPVLTGPELLAMNGGDTAKAEEMAKGCQNENDELTKKMMISERRLLRMLGLSKGERRELAHESEECGAGGAGGGDPAGGPPPDPLADAMCTPCQTAAAKSPAFMDTAKARPLNQQAYENGELDWCAADLNNFRAVAADKPELVTAAGPVPPAEYYNPTDPATGQVYSDPAVMYPPGDYPPDGIC